MKSEVFPWEGGAAHSLRVEKCSEPGGCMVKAHVRTCEQEKEQLSENIEERRDEWRRIHRFLTNWKQKNIPCTNMQITKCRTVSLLLKLPGYCSQDGTAPVSFSETS